MSTNICFISKIIKYISKKQKAIKSEDFKGLIYWCHITGVERIELPPKVLETPIIPFDYTPILNWVNNNKLLFLQNCILNISIIHFFIFISKDNSLVCSILWPSSLRKQRRCFAWLSPRPISISQLNTLPCLHL